MQSDGSAAVSMSTRRGKAESCKKAIKGFGVCASHEEAACSCDSVNSQGEEALER